MSSLTLPIIQANLAIQILNKLIENETSPIIYSPISLAIAFSMTYAGSSGLTKEHIKKFLLGDLDDEELHKHFNKFLIDLSENTESCLQSANKVYVKNGLHLLEQFTQTIKQYYQGNIDQIDFTAPNASDIINEFTQKATNNLIKDIIKPGYLNSQTMLVLINAIYFKGQWAKQFDKMSTETDNFYVSENVTKKVDMMYIINNFFYYEDNDYQVVRLPYEGYKQSMVILLPKERFSLLKKLSSFDGNKLFHMIGSLKSEKVHINLPKFKSESTHQLHEIFQKLGLTIPFTDDADFSLMTNEASLKINMIIQKAFVEVDEVGTEAAAATLMAMAFSLPREVEAPREYIFRADHPFMYFIIDNEKNILFNGIYQ